MGTQGSEEVKGPLPPCRAVSEGDLWEHRLCWRLPSWRPAPQPLLQRQRALSTGRVEVHRKRGRGRASRGWWGRRLSWEAELESQQAGWKPEPQAGGMARGSVASGTDLLPSC